MGLLTDYVDLDYHLELQANPKKIVQKTNAIFSIYGRNGIISWHFLKFSLRPFEVWWWILIEFFWKFSAGSESLAPNLEKVR